MEATRNWGLYYETVKPYVEHFYLGHPLKMRAITQSETKTDKNDADMIAKLTQSGFLPKAHISSSDTRELRSLLRFRTFLVGQRRAIRNQVSTLIDRNLWPTQLPRGFKNLFCQKGLCWLKELPLPERERFILNQCLESFDELSKKIEMIERFVQEQALDLEGLEHLRTVPGFRTSKTHLYTVLLEIDAINRFPKAKSLAHYAGLVPREYSSGDKHHRGRLVKQANLNLRQAILESVFGAILNDRALKTYYQATKARAGSGAAIIATARKLCFAIYHVLKDKRDYIYQNTQTTDTGSFAATSNNEE
jgi:transposase